MPNFCLNLRGLLLFSAAAAFSLTSIYAATICGPGTAASYASLGSSGCQEGNLLFNNFVYTPTANPAVLAIPSIAVAITPIPTLLNEGFGFQIASGFAATAPGSFIDGVLQYVVSTLDGGASLTGLSLNTNGTSTGTGLASVSENFCPGGTSTVDCSGLRNISVQSAGGSLSNSAAYGPASRLAVSKDIDVSAGGSGTATTSLVTNQFSNGPGSGLGFMEICKESSPANALSGFFSFAVSGQSGTFVAPVNACTLPFQLSAGPATLTELPQAGAMLSSVSTFPDNRLVSFDLTSGTAIVQTVAGDISKETVVTFTNTSSIPEPGTEWLLGSGLTLWAFCKNLKKRPFTQLFGKG